MIMSLTSPDLRTHIRYTNTSNWLGIVLFFSLSDIYTSPPPPHPPLSLEFHKRTLLILYNSSTLGLGIGYVDVMIKNGEMFRATAAFRSRNYSSLAALILVVADHLLTSVFEYTNIWPPPYRSVKLLYLCSRYMGLVSQIAHYTLIHTHLAKASVSTPACRFWIMSLLSSSVCLLLVLDGVLFLRLYALYQKRRRILWILVPIIIQPVLIGISTRRSLFKEGDLNEICDYKGSLMDAVLLSVVVLLTHILLWVLTYLKRNVAQGQAVVVKVVVQESAWVLALLFAMLVGIAPYSSMKYRVSPFFILSWSIALESIMGCRLIMNIRRLKIESDPQDNDAGHYVLSTVILSCNTTSDGYCESPPQIEKASNLSSKVV